MTVDRFKIQLSGDGPGIEGLPLSDRISDRISGARLFPPRIRSGDPTRLTPGSRPYSRSFPGPAGAIVDEETSR